MCLPVPAESCCDYYKYSLSDSYWNSQQDCFQSYSLPDNCGSCEFWFVQWSACDSYSSHYSLSGSIPDSSEWIEKLPVSWKFSDSWDCDSSKCLQKSFQTPVGYRKDLLYVICLSSLSVVSSWLYYCVLLYMFFLLWWWMYMYMHCRMLSYWNTEGSEVSRTLNLRNHWGLIRQRYVVDSCCCCCCCCCSWCCNFTLLIEYTIYTQL